MKRVYDFIKNCKVYYISTVSENKPKVRPFGTINIFEDKLYIQTGKSKLIFKELEKNAYAEISCFDGNTWLRLSGKLVNDDRIEPKKDMLDHFPELRTMYNENDDNTAVLYFENAKAEFLSFTDKPVIIEF